MYQVFPVLFLAYSKIRLVGEGLGNEATVAIRLVHNCYTLLHLYIASQRAKQESLRKMKKLVFLNHLQRLVECTSNMLNPDYGFGHFSMLQSTHTVDREFSSLKYFRPCAERQKLNTRNIKMRIRATLRNRRATKYF